MKKRKKTIVATSLSIMMLCSSGGVTVFGQTPTEYEQYDKGEITSITDYRSDIAGNDLLTPGFVISPDINIYSSEIVSVIVELREEPLCVTDGKSQRSSEVKINEEHESFKNNINNDEQFKVSGESQINVEIGNEFFYAFNGITMNISADKLPEIANMPQVKRIWNNKEVKLPESNIPEVKALPEDGIIQIGADKLHDENITGEGIKVGVIDTGIDYNHPQLKDVYKGGYDFVNNDDDPMETTYNEWTNSGGYPETISGNAYYTSHGTHVSGTIAANGEKGNAKGIAPNVDLYVYKVLGPYGTGKTDWILAGIDKAVEDGMDVINLSLGDGVNDSLTPSSVAINNAATAGVVPVVSSGNAGPREYTVASPGVSPLAITVGASDTNLIIPIYDGNITDKVLAIKLLANNYDFDLNSLKNQTLEMVDCGIGKVEDFEGKDLDGKIALIKRGEVSFNEKISNAKNAGAELVFIYNNEEGYINTFLEEDYNYIPTFNLTKADGEEVVKNIENDKMFTFDNISSEIQKGDKLADFSSRGPVAGTSEIKPDVVAPGVNIYSTYPEFINHKEDGEDYSKAYAKISGTSMSSPHVTGVVALMLENAKNNGKTMSVEDIKVALMNTADELNGDYNVYEKGSGRIDAYEAVKSTVEFKVNNKSQTIENNEVVDIDTISGALQFGNVYRESIDENSEKIITITNNSQEDKEYNLSVLNSTPKGLINDSLKNGVKLNTSESVKVKAGETLDLPVSIVIPDSAEYGFYEGVLKFENISESKEDYLVPYGINYVEKGIKQFNLDRNAIVDEYNTPYAAFNPFVNFVISINSPMEYQRLYLKDAKTDKRIGLISEFDVSNVKPGIQYYMAMAFEGHYRPMIGDYVENRFELAKEGHYNIEMEVTDKDGKYYSSEEDLIIDNTPPVVTFDKEPGIYSVGNNDYTEEDGVQAFYLKGRIYDDTIDKLNELGYITDIFGKSINQKLNTLQFAYNKPNEYAGYTDFEADLDEDGNFKIGIEPTDIENAPLELRFNPFDYATAANGNDDMIMYEFYKEGTPFGCITYNTEERLEVGDTFESNASIANMENLTEINFEFSYDKTVYEVESVTLNKDFENMLKNQGLEATLDTKIYESEWDRRIGYEVSIKITGDDEGIDITDLTSIIDIKREIIYLHPGVKSDNYYVCYGQRNEPNVFIGKDGETKNFYLMCNDKLKVRPKTTYINFSFTSAEGFFDEDKKLNYSLQFNQMGSKAYIIYDNGERYDLTINKDGSIREEVPADLKEGTLYVEVPGHFKNYTKIKLGKEFEKDVFGINNSIRMLAAYAGDMNGDNIIDDKDKEILNSDIGKTTVEGEIYLASDINKDRKVDEKDLAYITKNFGVVNPRMMEDAEVAMATVSEEKNISNLIVALEKVESLPECEEKEGFIETLDKLSDELRLEKEMKKITKAVEKAEHSRQQKHVDEARELVNSLPKCDIKIKLSKRLDTIKIK